MHSYQPFHQPTHLNSYSVIYLLWALSTLDAHNIPQIGSILLVLIPETNLKLKFQKLNSLYVLPILKNIYLQKVILELQIA